MVLTRRKRRRGRRSDADRRSFVYFRHPTCRSRSVYTVTLAGMPGLAMSRFQRLTTFTPVTESTCTQAPPTCQERVVPSLYAPPGRRAVLAVNFAPSSSRYVAIASIRDDVSVPLPVSTSCTRQAGPSLSQRQWTSTCEDPSQPLQSVADNAVAQRRNNTTNFANFFIVLTPDGPMHHRSRRDATCVPGQEGYVLHDTAPRLRCVELHTETRIVTLSQLL
jgi:hypothetical protein